MNVSKLINIVCFKENINKSINIDNNNNYNNLNMPKLNELSEDTYCKMNNYSEDELYKKELLSAIGKDKKDLDKLSCIMGKQEFEDILVDKDFHDEDNDNIFLRQYTNKSFGKKDIKTILEEAVKWKSKNNEKLVLCITDYHNVDACKEALEIIYNNPEKFKDIRVVLGFHNTNCIYNENGDGHATFVYCINPYEKVFSKEKLQSLDFSYYYENSKSNTVRGVMDHVQYNVMSFFNESYDAFHRFYIGIPESF